MNASVGPGAGRPLLVALLVLGLSAAGCSSGGGSSGGGTGGTGDTRPGSTAAAPTSTVPATTPGTPATSGPTLPPSDTEPGGIVPAELSRRLLRAADLPGTGWTGRTVPSSSGTSGDCVSGDPTRAAFATLGSRVQVVFRTPDSDVSHARVEETLAVGSEAAARAAYARLVADVDACRGLALGDSGNATLERRSLGVDGVDRSAAWTAHIGGAASNRYDHDLVAVRKGGVLMFLGVGPGAPGDANLRAVVAAAVRRL